MHALTQLSVMFTHDSVNYNFTFQSVDENQKCENGSFKVALVIDPGIDYHWYRQNSDGTWSHKPGGGCVRNHNYNNNLL